MKGASRSPTAAAAAFLGGAPPSLRQCSGSGGPAAAVGAFDLPPHPCQVEGFGLDPSIFEEQYGSGNFVACAGAFEMFPLPTVPEPARLTRLGRRASRRVCRRLAVARSANETIRTLNALAGAQNQGPQRYNSARVAAVERILNACARLENPDVCVSPQAALLALLGSKLSPYEGGPVSAAPFEASRLSLPARGGGCSLGDVLVGDDALDLERFEERLFLAPGDLATRRGVEGKARCYWDSVLADSPDVYHAFIRDLTSREMLRFSTVSEETVGVFCVEKKNKKLRVIIDCRRLNQRMRRPPRTPLVSSSALSDVWLDGRGAMHYSCHDVADCFYQFRVPGRLSRYLSLRAVFAGDVGVSVTEEGPVSANAKIYPQLAVLPVGFTFALHWAQQAHLEVLRRCGVPGVDNVLFDFRPVPCLSSEAGHIVYVDNGIVLSGVSGLAGETRRLAQLALESYGLPVHDIVEETQSVQALGLQFEKDRVTVTPPAVLEAAARGGRGDCQSVPHRGTVDAVGKPLAGGLPIAYKSLTRYNQI